MWCIVTIFQTDPGGFGGIHMECYGPFKTIAEAKEYAKLIEEFPRIIMIERLWETMS